jgi:plastocyanin
LLIQIWAERPAEISNKFIEGRLEMKRAYLTLLVFGLVAVIAAASAAHRSFASGPSKPAAPTEVKIDNFSFAPLKLAVPAGTTVKWTNRDDIPHTVVSEDNKTFKSEVLDTNQEFTHTFSKPGTYRYFCSLHPRMEAEIVVGE